jgi:multiple sugar transport system permease protein
MLLAPAAALLAVVVVAPIARLAWLSLCRTELVGGIRLQFAGLEPHLGLWSDTRWYSALRNTATFTSLSVAIEMILGIAFAYALRSSVPGRRWIRAAVLTPWALPTAVMALAWAWIFNDSFGVLNDLLSRLGWLRQPVAWLGSPASAMGALIVTDVWKTTPFVALVVLAGLQGVPASVLEAARLDGASTWGIFWRIELPLIAPSCLVALGFRAAQALAAFDLPYVMTGGGPGGATETLSLYAYRCFYRYLDFGSGAAMALQGTALALLVLAAILRLARRESA